MTMSALPFAKKGSQRWLQIAVERAPEILNAPLDATGVAIFLVTYPAFELSPHRRSPRRES
jgi:hypothetical protein